jgi:hypothetical protein
MPCAEALEARTLPSTFFVTNLGDAGAGRRSFGDLRYCLSRANASPGEDRVVFAVEGTIHLTQPLPDITDDALFTGPGADRLTIRRDTGGNYRVLKVNTGVTAQIYGVTVTNGFYAGSSPEAGGGVFNGGTLILGWTRVVGNHAEGPCTTALQGGGIFNGGTLTVYGSTIADNTLDCLSGGPFGGAVGGGVANHASGTLMILDSADGRCCRRRRWPAACRRG